MKLLVERWKRRESSQKRSMRRRLDNHHRVALPERMTNMRVFIVSCIIGAAIAIGAAVVLQEYQEPAAVAFPTPGVRI